MSEGCVVVDEDRRVELRATLVGRGNATTPERIAELQRQAAEIDKARPVKPRKPFADVMATKGAEQPAAALPTREKKRRSLPKKGPKPGLVHPVQREVYGRGEDGDDNVVLKG
jgi:hypothetical protein